jgi:hypothetical protein
VRFFFAGLSAASRCAETCMEMVEAPRGCESSNVSQCGVRYRQPVHAVMLIEALVFRANDSRQRCRGNVAQLRPREPPSLFDHAQFVYRCAMAVEQDAFGGRPAALHFVEGGNPPQKRGP